MRQSELLPSRTRYPRPVLLQRVLLTGALARLVAGQRDTMHCAPEPLIIIHWIVLGAAIIPEGEGTLPPAKAAGEFWPSLVLE